MRTEITTMMLICYSRQLSTKESCYLFSYRISSRSGRCLAISCPYPRRDTMKWSAPSKPPRCSWCHKEALQPALGNAREQQHCWGQQSMDTMRGHTWALHAPGVTGQPRWGVSARMHQESCFLVWSYIQCLCLSQHRLCTLNTHMASWCVLCLQNPLCSCPLKATAAPCSQKTKWH